MLIFGTLCIGFVVGYGLYLFVFFRNVKKIKAMAIGYFKIIPKQTLEKMEVSAYMNDNKLLDKISML